jgi:hypothetical protein
MENSVHVYDDRCNVQRVSNLTADTNEAEHTNF